MKSQAMNSPCFIFRADRTAWICYPKSKALHPGAPCLLRHSRELGGANSWLPCPFSGEKLSWERVHKPCLVLVTLRKTWIYWRKTKSVAQENKNVLIVCALWQWNRPLNKMTSPISLKVFEPRKMLSVKNWPPSLQLLADPEILMIRKQVGLAEFLHLSNINYQRINTAWL